MSPVPAQRLCFRRINFVAGIFDAPGNMNTFSDGRPVSWKNSMSILAPAPDVQPVSKMPDLFAIFCFHFSAVLFFTVGFANSDVRLVDAQHMVGRHLLPPALRLGRTVGTNN
jgi:hypothetical protein